MRNLNGKQIIFIGVLIPIVLLLLFGESYNPGPNPSQHNSYIDYLMNTDLVFYDEYQQITKENRLAPVEFGRKYKKIKVQFTTILALSIVVIGAGIYKINESKENDSENRDKKI